MPIQQQLQLGGIPAADMKLAEAREIAEKSGLIVSFRGDRFRLFRKTAGRQAFLGSRGSAGDLLGLVKRAARSN